MADIKYITFFQSVFRAGLAKSVFAGKSCQLGVGSHGLHIGRNRSPGFFHGFAKILFYRKRTVIFPCHVFRCVRTFYISKIQLRHKPAGPVHAQRILRKPLFRIAYRTQQLRFQILLSAIKIIQRPLRVHRHGVDRKIPAGQILLQRIAKPYLRRPVRILSIGIALIPKGCDFQRMSLRHCCHYAKIFAQVFRQRVSGSAKYRSNLLRTGAGCNIVIAGFPAQQQIAHRAAHHIRFESGSVQKI